MSCFIDESNCTVCEVCISECPVNAITMGFVYPVVNDDTCTDCGICIDECPESCISEK